MDLFSKKGCLIKRLIREKTKRFFLVRAYNRLKSKDCLLERKNKIENDINRLMDKWRKWINNVLSPSEQKSESFREMLSDLNEECDKKALKLFAMAKNRFDFKNWKHIEKVDPKRDQSCRHDCVEYF